MIKSLMIISLFLVATSSLASETQLSVGSTFGRSFFSAQEKSKIPSHLLRAARSAAVFDKASAFYIGEFEGRHLVATNAHTFMTNDEEWDVEDYLNKPVESCKIFPGFAESEAREVGFGLIQRYFSCKVLIGIWPEIDFAIFEIENKDNFTFSNMGLDISSKQHISFGQPLAMFSYSPYNNPGYINIDLPDTEVQVGFDLAYTQDEHCRSFINQSEATLLYDNEEKLNGVWSFPIGCDIAPGDSGSPVVDEKTGLFSGIIWAGAEVRDIKAYDDKYLSSVLSGDVSLEETDSFVWTQLNYAVPAHKILDVISMSLKDMSEENKKTLKLVLGI